MSRMNRIVLIGTLTGEPEVKATNSGDSVANFQLQVERPSRPEELQPKTDTFTVVAWRDLATETQSYTPGTTLLVEGQILTRNYEDNEGRRIYKTEVDAKEIKVISGSSQSFESPAAMPEEAPPVLEPKTPAADASFQFDNAADQVPQGLPPEFSADVEEDVPF